MKKCSLWLCPLAIAAIVALDQWVKAYIVTHFAVGESAEFLPQLLRLHYVRNFGAAWSSFSGERWLLIGVTSLICIAGIYLLFFGRRKLPVFPSVCIAMAVGGALGNLYDRALLGYVIDMLDFRLINFAVFNVADSFVCVGIILLGVWMVFFEEKQMPRQPYRWGAPKPAEQTTGEQNHAHDPKQGDN